MDERKLILGLKRGDHDSYEILFKLYYAKFVNFADAIIKDRNAAKDIVQEAFIRYGSTVLNWMRIRCFRIIFM